MSSANCNPTQLASVAGVLYDVKTIPNPRYTYYIRNPEETATYIIHEHAASRFIFRGQLVDSFTQYVEQRTYGTQR